MKFPQIYCLIPARLAASRFPRKMLAPIAGKPLLQHVYEAASSVTLFSKVIIAVDAHETEQFARSLGANVIMTSQECQSGTDRLIEAASKINDIPDVWVNWQGDEPFFRQGIIEDLLQSATNPTQELWTLKKRITDPSEVTARHFAKVVCDNYGNAMYFSRSPIPFYRDTNDFEKMEYYKHVGIYAYRPATLARIAQLKAPYFEVAEQLEQLRFLAAGVRVTVHETLYDSFGIDLPEHQQKAEQFILQNTHKD